MREVVLSEQSLISEDEREFHKVRVTLASAGGQDRKHNLMILHTGEVCYYLSCVCVIYDVHTRQQRILTAHDGEIVCTALHPDGLTVASADTGERRRLSVTPSKDSSAGKQENDGSTSKGSLLVWDVISMKLLQTLRGSFGRGVLNMSFSADGEKLAVVCDDGVNTLSVWDWQSGVHLAQEGTFREKVHAVLFNPRILDQSGIELAVCGDGCIAFWDVWNAKIHKDSSIRGDMSGEKLPVHCIHYGIFSMMGSTFLDCVKRQNSKGDSPKGSMSGT